MKLLATIEAFGVDVTPWSVPDIGVTVSKTGKRVRFAKRGKKTNLDRGSVSLEHWQAFVRGAATEVWSTIPLQTGPLFLSIEFYARTPNGKRHGELWEVPLRWNEEKSEFAKTQPRGKQESDLINMFKGTEDALGDVVFANDVQTRMVSAVTLYGPSPGVIVAVYQIEPSDFPGVGERLER